VPFLVVFPTPLTYASINRAGAAGNFLAPITQLSANAFKSVIDIDVLGSYNTMKATLPHVLASAAIHRSDGTTPNPRGTGGRFLFISATIHYTALPLQTHVSAAKAGVDSLSNSLALEMGPRGVTSNVIAPGAIAATEGVARLVRNTVIDASVKMIPAGRYGTVKEIADATVYLFSDSGNYVNGSTVVGELYTLCRGDKG
jgi:peroxisomal 2,4-dienoyl-CoA reductase